MAGGSGRWQGKCVGGGPWDFRGSEMIVHETVMVGVCTVLLSKSVTLHRPKPIASYGFPCQSKRPTPVQHASLGELGCWCGRTGPVRTMSAPVFLKGL